MHQVWHMKTISSAFQTNKNKQTFNSLMYEISLIFTLAWNISDGMAYVRNTHYNVYDTYLYDDRRGLAIWADRGEDPLRPCYFFLLKIPIVRSWTGNMC